MRRFFFLAALIWFIEPAAAQTAIDIARQYDGLVKATSLVELEHEREAAIDLAWGAASPPQRYPGELPTTYPVSSNLTAIGEEVVGNPSNANPAFIRRIEKVLSQSSSTFDPGPGQGTSGNNDSNVYYPLVRDVNRLVILNFGHQVGSAPIIGCRWETFSTNYQIPQVMNELLQAGFTVYAFNMPACGWYGNNTNTHGYVSGAQGTTVTGITAIAPRPQGYRWFWLPIVETINWFEAHRPFINYSIIGLSGGGWTAHTYSALDPRILVNIGVSGAMPGYIFAGGVWPGDGEQQLPEFYSAFPYMDIFLASAVGPDRYRKQILLYGDDCCFGDAQWRGTTPSGESVANRVNYSTNATILSRCFNAPATQPATCPWATWLDVISARLQAWGQGHGIPVAQLPPIFKDRPAAQGPDCEGRTAADKHQVSNCARAVIMATLASHGSAIPLPLTARLRRRVL